MTAAIAFARTDLDVARAVLGTEAAALRALAASLDDAFTRAVDLLATASGRVVVSGMGKSGHVARKIAATLASTGTPALFVHPAEASHGDLGMIVAGDAVLALSNSGETQNWPILSPMRAASRCRWWRSPPAPVRRWRRRRMSRCCCRRPPRPARWAWRPPPAPPCRWRWAMPWRSRC